jgi:hypothetical protein
MLANRSLAMRAKYLAFCFSLRASSFWRTFSSGTTAFGGWPSPTCACLMASVFSCVQPKIWAMPAAFATTRQPSPF